MAMRWYGAPAKMHVHGLIGRRIDAAARHLVRRIKENISTKYPPVSKPGEFPHLRTNTLRSRVTSEYEEQTNTARVGSNYKVFKFLELGTRKMARRPLLTLGLMKYKGEIKRILQRGKVG